MSATVSITLDTRRIKASNCYPIKLRITFKREPRRYQTVYDLAQCDYNKLVASRISAELQEVKAKLHQIKQDAENFIKNARPFDFYEFERDFIKGNPLFRQRTFKAEAPTLPPDEFDFTPYYKRFPIFDDKHPSLTSLSYVFLVYIKGLLQQGRVGNAINYLRSYRSLVSFRGNVRLEDISVSYLYQYEQWMMEKNNTKTTIGIVLCPLRAVFNESIENGLIRRDKHYPFGRRRYQIPGSRNLKKALHIDDLKRIFYYHPEDIDVQRGKDFWFFCYLANGMNVKDMLYLKEKNIQDEYIVIDRAKTERTARGSARPIIIYLTDDLKKITKTYGRQNRKPNYFHYLCLRTPCF